MKNYINDCINLYKNNRRFIIKACTVIMILYAAMAAIAVYWDQISAWIHEFFGGRKAIKWNPGKMGKFVTYDDDTDDLSSGGLDPEDE